MKIAVIDIGSNSVRLMMWAGGKTLYKRLATTRLGEGLAYRPLLKDEAIERSARATASFYDAAIREGAKAVYAFATAAVRSAENGGVFCARVNELCGLTVDVVSGKEEADLALFGVLGEDDGGIIDIGGASTEICYRIGGEKTFSTSLNAGAVRLFDACGDDAVKLREAVSRCLSVLPAVKTAKTYAVGGTATALAALKLELEEYDADKIQDCPLSLAETESLAEKLLSLSAERRRNLAGIDARRADIIAGGALLLCETMKKLGLCEVFVSDRDNLEGYLAVRGLV